MKPISKKYKDTIKKFGRQLDSKLSYESNGEMVEINPEQINSIRPYYDGAILKSVMKHLDIDSNIDLPIGTEINYKFGVKIRSGKNIFDITQFPFTENKSYGNDGTWTTWSGYSAIAGYVPVEGSTQYTFSNNLNKPMYYGLVEYDENKEKINYTSRATRTFTTQADTRFIRFAIQATIPTWVQIEKGPIATNYEEFGPTHEYIDYGNYVVYSSEKQEDTNSYLIKCYDKLLYSMVDYESLNITYPITIRDYISALCNHLGLTFKNASDTFANYDKLIKSELYLDSDGNSLAYTFRDVLDELAQATASTICIDEETDELEIRYINNTSILPSEYTQVDYIQSTGTQFIDMGIVGNQDTKFELSITPTSLSNVRHVLGNIVTSTAGISFNIANSDGAISRWGNDRITRNSGLETNVNYLISISQNGYYVNNNLWWKPTINNFTTNGNLYLFAANGSTSRYAGKLYYCQVYDNNTLVRDFVPCYRNSDNEVGLYDLVNDVFYTNQGSGSFTYGEEIADTIDEEFFKDINVNFAEKYGPVNSIVLSRGAGSDNVYLQDEDSIEENGLCEIKISDNQIMNDNDRSDFLPDLLEKLDGLEYYLNDYSSTGITFYELCDRYNVSIRDKTYSCIMFNDEVNITQGLEEFVHTDMPEESVTDYTKADKTDRRINRTELIVNKQQGEINALSEKIIDLSNTIGGIGEITLENAYEGAIHQLKIVGNLSLIFPNDSQKYGFSQMIRDDLLISQDTLITSGVPYENDIIYPSTNLYPKKYRLKIDDDKEYLIDLDFLNYINATTHDEWVYEEGKQYIIRRVGINSQGEKYALDEEVIEYLNDIEPIIIEKDSNIKLLPNEGARLEATYLLENEYTSSFTTKYEVKSEINIRADEIEQKVSGVADDEGNVTSASIILAINNDESSAIINADKIELEGNDVINAIAGNEINLTSKNINISSDNFSVDSSGNLSCTNASVNGAVTSNNVNITGGTIDITTTLGNVTIGKGTSGLIAMNGTYQSNYFDGMYNVGGMYYRMNNGYRFRIAAASNSPYISLYNSSGEKTFQAETLNSSGYLMVNNSSGNTTIDLTGSSGVVSCVRVVQTSQEKNKKNFELYDNALEEVLKTDIYKYNLFNEKDSEKKHVGFVIGENRNYSHDITAVDEEGKEIGVDDYSMISVLWKAVQEQQEQIEELKNKLNKLEGNDI